MADPLSVAGAAIGGIGVIQVGLKVCAGLRRFVDAAKRSTSETESIQQLERNLRATLRLVQTVLLKIQDQHDVARTTIEDSLALCIDKLEEINAVLKKARVDRHETNTSLAAPANDESEAAGPSTSLTSRMNIKTVVKKVMFPLWEKDIMLIQSNINTILLVLQTAMDAVCLESTLVTRDEISQLSLLMQAKQSDMLELKTLAIANATAASKIEVHLSHLALQASSFPGAKSHEARRNLDGSPLIAHSVVMKPKFGPHIKIPRRRVRSRQSKSLLEAQGVLAAEIFAHKKRILEKPSYLRELCDAAETVDAFRNDTVSRMASNASPPTCNCSPTRKEITRAVWWGAGDLGFFARQGEYGKHRRNCILYRSQDIETTVSAGVQLRVAISRTLTSLLALSLSFTKGAGGSSIAASYRCRREVHWDAPAFELIHKCFQFETERQYETERSILRKGFAEKPRSLSTMERVRLLDETREKLLSLFRQGIACPDDVNSWANKTLLSEIVDRTARLSDKTCFDAPTVEGIIRLIQAMISAGVPTELYPSSSTDPMTNMLLRTSLRASGDREAQQRYLYALGEIWGPQVDVMGYTPHSQEWKWVRSLQYCPMLEQVLVLDPLSRAIQLRSEAALLDAIASNPRQVRSLRFGALTPLHLASAWPRGLEILLRSGAQEIIDDCDSNGASPFVYTCVTGCAEALDVLLRHGCNLMPDGNSELLEMAFAYAKNDNALTEGLALACASRRDDWLKLLADSCESASPVVDQGLRLIDTVDRHSLLGMYRIIRQINASIGNRLESDNALFEDWTTILEHETGLEAGELSNMSQSDTETNTVIKEAYETFAQVVHNTPAPDQALIEKSARLAQTPIVPFSIYHLSGIPVSSWPALLSAGFANPNIQDVLGRTPIMVPRRQEFIIDEESDPKRFLGSLFPWLQHHNCLESCPSDPHGIGLNKGASGAHYLAAQFGLFLQTGRYGALSGSEATRMKLKSSLHQFARDLFAVPARDGCRCWCSASGCSPFTMFCKFFDSRRHRGADLFSLTGVLEFRTHAHPTAQELELEREFLRFLTFEALELTHTCCKWGSLEEAGIGSESFAVVIDFDPDDRNEIRTEEQQLGDIFEESLRVILEELRDSPGSLVSFIRNEWTDAMQMLCLPSEESRQQMRMAGAVPNDSYTVPEKVRCLLGPGFDIRRSRRYSGWYLHDLPSLGWITWEDVPTLRMKPWQIRKIQSWLANLE